MYSEGYSKAVALLHAASTPAGFVAAVAEQDNYKRVWARDSALCGLAALASEDQILIETFRASIETILAHQHPGGFVPSNVAADGSISYGGAVGRVDNHAWIIISACTYAAHTGKTDWLHQFVPAVQKIFALMQAWEFNGRGLMYVPQSADWADEYNHHGYILYNQLLRLWALRLAAKYIDAAYVKEHDRIQIAVQKYYTTDERYSLQGERLLDEWDEPYFLMGFNTSVAYNQFDLAANALALLLDVGTAAQREALMNFMAKMLSKGSMLPAFSPPIDYDDWPMQELKNNYAFHFRNEPHQFHNGGLWPVWNGLAALALHRHQPATAQHLSSVIEKACSINDWEFNECFHGKTGAPNGVPYCAWSAAGLVLSRQQQFIHQLI